MPTSSVRPASNLGIINDGSKIVLDREEEPAAGARNAGVASVVYNISFLMLRPPSQEA